MKEVTWLAAIVVHLLGFFLGTRLIIIKVVVVVSAISGVAIVIVSTVVSGRLVSSVVVISKVCIRTVRVLCIVTAFYPSVSSIWVNWTWVS